jgi:hypothetical protein
VSSSNPPRRRLALAVLFGLCAAPALAHDSLCRPGESALFSCRVGGGKLASLCASADLGANAGTLQYRFGTRASVELAYPEPPAHPRASFRRGSIAFSGGGGDFVSFSRGVYVYTLYSAVSPAGDVEGVAVRQDGRLVANLPCTTPALDSQDNWARLYQAGLPEDGTPFTPPAPRPGR